MITLIVPFPGIRPINTLQEALARGNYTSSERSLRCFWQEQRMEVAPEAKDINVVCFPKTTWDPEKELSGLKLRMCRCSPNFLFGLMAAIPEAEMPEALNNMSIIAYEPENKKSLFTEFRVYEGDKVLAVASLPIMVQRHVWNGDRFRNLEFVQGACCLGQNRALLAEGI